MISLRYNNTYGIFKRLHKSGFSNGSIDKSFNVPTNKLDSFLPHQLVEAYLEVCMPALGDRIKIIFYEIVKPLGACMQYSNTEIRTSHKSNHFEKKSSPQSHIIN